MPQITFIDHAGTRRTVEGQVGSTVMETALKNAVPGIEAECGGACACATCHVYVDESWIERLHPPTDEEMDRLDDAFAVETNSRLACQILVTPDISGLRVHLAPDME